MPDSSNAAASRITKVSSRPAFPLVFTQPRMKPRLAKMAKSKAARRKQHKREAVEAGRELQQ